VDRVQGLFVVSHRAIPGFMPAMVMPFRADPPSQLNELRPGARVTFDLVVDKKTSRARRIRLEGAPASAASNEDDFKMPAAANQLAIGSEVPDFALTDQDGHQVRLSHFQNQVVAIQFVYTRCPLPDVCPRLAAHFAFLHRKLRDQVQLLTITLDPTYDTPTVIKDYAGRWKADDPHWRFLTGAEERIREVAGRFGVVFWPEEGAITHTSSTAIIGKDGRLKALVEGSSYRPEQLLDLVSSYLR
jgi:protein SCO1/2